MYLQIEMCTLPAKADEGLNRPSPGKALDARRTIYRRLKMRRRLQKATKS